MNVETWQVWMFIGGMVTLAVRVALDTYKAGRKRGYEEGLQDAKRQTFDGFRRFMDDPALTKAERSAAWREYLVTMRDNGGLQ